MIRILTASLFLVCSVVHATCENLPQEGYFEYPFAVRSGPQMVTAVFSANVEKSTSPEGTVHSFNLPTVKIDGEPIHVSRDGLTKIAQRLGYERVEYVLLKSENEGSFFNRKYYLGGDYTIRQIKSTLAVVNPEGSASFYHRECANWRY